LGKVLVVKVSILQPGISENSRVAKQPFASVTRTVNVAVVTEVGVPEISPALDNVKPVGKAPAEIVHVTAPVAPVTDKVWL
jgi:hypothetical protein